MIKKNSSIKFYCLLLLTTVAFTLSNINIFPVQTALAEETTLPETIIKQKMVSRPLGKTGQEIPLFSLGGASIGKQESEEKSLEIINHAIDMGVKYIDTAPRYVNGLSEIYIGKVMKTRRDEVFLATKSHDFTYDGTMRLVKQSLQRLQTDHIDLYQHHGVFYDYQLNPTCNFSI